MEFIIEVLSEVIILYLFSYPGAFFLWVMTGCKKTFKEVLNSYPYGNAMLGVLFFAGIIILIKAFARFNSIKKIWDRQAISYTA